MHFFNWRDWCRQNNFYKKFYKLLARKKGIEQTEVLSPTFNLLYEYDLKNLKLSHYDLYRVKSTKELVQLGIFKEPSKTIYIIEWPELIEIEIANRLELHLSYTTKENERKLKLKGFGKWKDFDEDKL